MSAQPFSKNSISLYFHIPFCTKKCPYCHFYVIPNRLPDHRLLSEGLQWEWEQKKHLLVEKEILSIYFGGGTPSLFPPEELRGILNRAKELSLAPDCEITLEANPEELTQLLLEAFLSLGINRLSLGVQSLDDRSLETLERIHTAQKAKRAIQLAKTCGFANISIDLMYDLPSQTEASFDYTLAQLFDLPIDHVSLYNLMIEPHTPFFLRQKNFVFPSEQESLRMLEKATLTFEALGLARYEISAFAKPQKQSRHNSGYWTNRPFLGFGPSAFSYWEKERFQNIGNLLRYHQTLKEGRSPLSFREKLSEEKQVRERLAIGLRMVEGVEIEIVNPPSQELASTLQKLFAEGFLSHREKRLQLTEKGRLFYDTVATAII